MVSKTGHVLAYEDVKAGWGCCGGQAGGKKKKKRPGYRTGPYLLKDFEPYPKEDKTSKGFRCFKLFFYIHHLI